MEMVRYESTSGYDWCKITCTAEQYKMLKEALELEGVNVRTSSIDNPGSPREIRTIYFMNHFKSHSEYNQCKEYFERDKKRW